MKLGQKKLLSVVSAVAILLVSLMAAIPMSAVAGAAADPVEIFTDVNGFNVWANPYTLNYTITENPWKIVRGSNDAQTELRYDTNRYGDTSPITIDVNKTPILEYDLVMSGDFEIMLGLNGADGYFDEKIIVGGGTGTYDLRTNEKIMATASHGVITIPTLKIQFVGSVNGSEMTVNTLHAVPAPAEPEPPVEPEAPVEGTPLFTNVDGFSVWGNPYNWNYTITENPWKFVRGANDGQTELRYDTNRYGDQTSISVDLNKTPIIDYDFDMSGNFVVQVAVDGVGDITVATGDSKGTYDLRANEAVMAAADHGVVTIPTVKVQFAGSAEGSEVTVNAFQLVPAPAEPEAPVEGTPLYTNVDGFSVWGNPYNWNYTITENPWKFVRGGNDGQTELRYDTNRYGDTTPISVDLNKAPIIDYDFDMSGNFVVQVAVDGVGDITVATGDSKGTYDLRANEAVMAAADHGVVTISTVKVQFVGSAEGSEVTVNAFQLVPVPADPEPPVEGTLNPMLTNVDGFNLWGNPADWNFTITQSPWKFVRGSRDDWNELRYDNNRYGDQKPLTVDLNKAPLITYDVEMDGNYDLIVCVGPVDSAVQVKICTGTGKGTYDLSKNADVKAMANHGVVEIPTIKFQFTGSAAGATITVNQLDAMTLNKSPDLTEDQKIAAAVEKQIADLGPADQLTLDKKADVEAARAAYEALTMDQVSLVKNLEALEAAEKAIADLIYNSPEEVNKRAAAALDRDISNIGYVSLWKETYIKQVRTDYDALNADAKGLVKNLAGLEAAEKALEDLKANPPAELEGQTETFIDQFKDNSFPLAVETSTGNGDPITSIFANQWESNQDIYAYYFGNDFNKSTIMLKQYTEVDAAITYEFKYGVKSLEFVGSSIWASIFKQEVNDVFHICWSDKLDGEYHRFVGSDIDHELVKIDENYGGEGNAKGGQSLAFFRVNNIPAEARYIRLFFKGSDPNADYPLNYANWQVPMGFLKVEAYKEQVNMEDDKAMEDEKSGVKLEGTLPAAGELTVADKSGSGVEGAADRFASDLDTNNILASYNVALKAGDREFDELETAVKLNFPVKGGAEGEKYAVLYYDPIADEFTVIPATFANGYAVAEITKMGDYVLVGNDAAKAAQDAVDPEPETPVDPDPETPVEPDPETPSTGAALPAAAMVLAAVSAGYVFSRKRK